MANRPKTKSKPLSVDKMMLNVASTLIRDFQTTSNDPCFCSDLQRRVRKGDIAGVREAVTTKSDSMTAGDYKAHYQMESLFKRYRFQNDTYSDEELTQKAIDGFMETQSRLADVDLANVDCKSDVILDLAASYVAKVLGPYSDEEHRNLCRFGRKASVGIPARAACEAARWELPISGSREQIAWFDSEMSEVDSVQEYWLDQLERDPLRSVYQTTSSLKLTLVPKTFKSLRAIMPNTTVGSYMSFGLGEIMRKRLKRKGYDISSLQMRHRYLARQGSIHELYTTADLSSASDSITDALVRRLFPSDWYQILVKSRIGEVELPNGTRVESLTFCTMGIGYTFPLQTLVFLALLKAVQAYYYKPKDRRLISVYGDDMIYHSRMHSQVCDLFKQIGLVINVDKTFNEGGFRESCGGDYFRGVDVRPFQPRNGSANVSPKAYEAVLYKFINGLLMRWSEYEIVETLTYLTSEVERVTTKCKVVPGNYPDDSGIKCPALGYWDFLQHARVAQPKKLGHGVYRFSYLRLKSDLRKEDRHVPFYWASLRALEPTPCYNGSRNGSTEPDKSVTALQIEALTGISVESEPLLITKEDKPIKTFRSTLTGRRLRRTSTFVTVSHTGRYTRQSGTSCFEFRR